MLRLESALTTDRTIKALTSLTRSAFRALTPAFNQALHRNSPSQPPLSVDAFYCAVSTATCGHASPQRGSLVVARRPAGTGTALHGKNPEHARQFVIGWVQQGNLAEQIVVDRSATAVHFRLYVSQHLFGTT